MRRLSESDFWQRVQRGEKSSCWNWAGPKIPGGEYGYACIGGIRGTAHSVAYRFAIGPVQKGLVVMHRCDNPACCNPDHLQIGTQKENLDDMRAKGRQGDCSNHGEKHGMCKVTDVQVSEIRRLYAEKKSSQEKLGVLFGIRQTHVSRIVRGESRVTQRI